MTYKYRSPISLPMIVGNYLIGELTDPDYVADKSNDQYNSAENRSRVNLGWTLSYLDSPTKSEEEGRNTWLVSFAGIPLATHEASERLEEGGGVEVIVQRPPCVLVIAWASGVTMPKWGLDDVRMRIHTLVDVEFAPSIVAEDMMERVKMALNSIDGREIWRLSHLPTFTYTDGERTFDWGVGKAQPPDLAKVSFGNLEGCPQIMPRRRWVADLIPLLYRVYKRADSSTAYVKQADGTVRPNPAAPKPDIDTITGTTSANRDPAFKYTHVANWASTVLDGNTIQQVVGGTPEYSYTAFSIDFSMYLELVHSDVLGYRKPFVDTLTP